MFIKTGTSPGTLYYIHKDHLGSITALTNSTGSIVEQYAYDPCSCGYDIKDSSGWGRFVPIIGIPL